MDGWYAYLVCIDEADVSQAARNLIYCSFLDWGEHNALALLLPSCLLPLSSVVCLYAHIYMYIYYALIHRYTRK